MLYTSRLLQRRGEKSVLKKKRDKLFRISCPISLAKVRINTYQEPQQAVVPARCCYARQESVGRHSIEIMHRNHGCCIVRYNSENLLTKHWPTLGAPRDTW